MLLSVALAGKPAEPVVADHTAQALSFGEFMIGTSGMHLGLVPRIQIGTQPLVFAVGLPNAAARIQIVEHPSFDLSVDAGWLGSGLTGLDLMALSGSVQTSIHTGRVSTHLALATNRFALEGVPTAAPKWIVGMIGQDPLAGLADMMAEANLETAAQVSQTRLRAAVEARVKPRSSVLLQGSMAVAGSTSFQARATLDQYDVDVGPGLPGARMLDEATRPAGSWIVSLAWQQQIGRIHLRAGYGVSKVPYAWAPQAFAAHVRGDAYGPRRVLQGKQ